MDIPVCYIKRNPNNKIKQQYITYRNFRSITRTADYPHGRLPAPADYCIRRKKKSTDYPHRWITRTLLFNFFGGENVTLRRYISVFRFRHVHNSVSILAYTLLIKLYSEN